MVPQTTPNRVTYLLDCFSLKKRNTDYVYVIHLRRQPCHIVPSVVPDYSMTTCKRVRRYFQCHFLHTVIYNTGKFVFHHNWHTRFIGHLYSWIVNELERYPLVRQLLDCHLILFVG